LSVQLALLILAQLSEEATALLCALTSIKATSALPKGWRNGVKRLRNFINCDDDEATVALNGVFSEDGRFLQGLEYPVTFFSIEIRKEAGGKAGCKLASKVDHLEVDKVLDGPVSQWNNNHTAKAVQAGDRIVSINGVQGNSTLMAAELNAAANATLHLIRLSPEDQALIEARSRQRELKRIMRLPAPPGYGGGIRESSGSDVVDLHARNIDKFLEAQEVALVLFYANWCGHCKEFAPDYTKAAALVAQMDLPRSVRLAKYDDGDQANREYQAGAPDKFNYTSFPTLIFYDHGNQKRMSASMGPDEVAAVVAAFVKNVDPDVELRKALLKTRPLLYRPDVSKNVVLDLEPETFDDAVLKESEKNNRLWVIEYYSDQCPFCRSLKPEYVKASEEMKKLYGAHVKFAAVNSRAFPGLAERFGVTSYPWVTSIYAGKKVEDMAGLGAAESIINWASLKYKEVWRNPPPAWTYAEKFAPASATQVSAADPLESANASAGTWRELLGQRTWFFLHTLAAKYPENPSEADQAGVRHLVASLGQHYPCPLCRLHLQAKLLDPKLGPVPTTSREELASWFCRLHNMVNSDLKKPMHSCVPFELDLKYLKSCGECSASKVVDAEAQDHEAGEAPKWNFFDYLAAAEAPKAAEDAPKVAEAAEDAPMAAEKAPKAKAGKGQAKTKEL